MIAAPRSFFVTGGTLQQDALSYVERAADDELYDALNRGEFCYVLTSRQMGKSSLMVHTTVRLRAEGVHVAVLDLTAIGQNLTAEQWYEGLLITLGTHLHLEDELEGFWFEHERLGPLQRWMRAVREVVLPALGVRRWALGVGEPDETAAPPSPNAQRLTPNAQGRLVIFIDEIDTVRSLPFSTDEFFAAIRECYNRRTTDPEFHRLTFCLLGVATPSDLIRDTRLTPFNIGRRIELTDFSEAEAGRLRAGLVIGKEDTFGWSDGEARALLQRILSWTGGHPYLTQRLCQALVDAQARNPKSKIQNPESIDRLCEELFLSPAALEQDNNLIFVRERLLRSEADRASLLDLYAQVRRGKRVRNEDTNPLVSLLRLSGITRVVNGCLQVRNRIYERVFDRAWVTAHMPDAEVRRQRAAYRRGLMRAAGLASVVVAVMSGLVGYALAQRNTAIRNAYFANINVIQSDWEHGNVVRIRERLTETRDYGGRGFEWGYWNRLCHLELLTLKGHTGTVYSVGFSPDGRRIVTGGSYDNTAKVWDAASGRETLTLKGHGNTVRCVSFSPDGQRILTGSDDHTARVWDAASGRLLLTLRLKGHTRSLTAVSFSPDGRRIVTGSYDNTVKVWDAASGREIVTLKLKRYTRTVWSVVRNYAPCVSLSPDGRHILTGSVDGTATVWDAENGRETLTLKGHTGPVSAVSFSPDGRRILTGSGDDTTAKVWDAASGRQVLTFKGHTGGVTAVGFSPAGRHILTGSVDNTAMVWDAASGRLMLTLKGHTRPVCSVSVSPDGRRIVTGSRDHTAKVWDATSGREALALKGHTALVRSVSFSPDGQRIVTGSWDNTARVWDTVSGREALTLKGHPGRVWSVSFSPDGQRIVTGSVDGTAAVWDAASGRKTLTLKALTPYGQHAIPDPVIAVSFSPDGRRILTGIRDQTAWVWDAASGRLMDRLKRAEQGYPAVPSFALDGQHIVRGIGNGTATVQDAASGRYILTLKGHIADTMSSITSVSFSLDGKRIVTGSVDGTATVWDAENGRETLTLKGHTGRVWSVSFSPDGQRIVTGSEDTTAKVWDAASGRETLTLKGHTDTVWCVSFSPDGRRIVTGSEDGTAKVWSSEDGDTLARLPGRAVRR
jgi:WD40 repeat protein